MALLRALENLGHFAHFAFRALRTLPTALLRRPGALVNQLYQVFVGALPLALAGGIAVGAVIWMHGRAPLKTVGGPAAVAILPCLPRRADRPLSSTKTSAAVRCNIWPPGTCAAGT